MSFFPFCIDIQDKPCLIVGGGTVALHKVRKLLPFAPSITVVAPCVCDKLKALDLSVKQRHFEDSDIDGAFMVVSATDNEELNSRIYTMCTERNILVNTVDDLNKCGFIFPALAQSGDVCVGITTGGKSPIYARFLREQIQELLDSIDPLVLDTLSKYRPLIKREIPTQSGRAAANEELLRLCLSGGCAPANECGAWSVECGVKSDGNDFSTTNTSYVNPHHAVQSNTDLPVGRHGDSKQPKNEFFESDRSGSYSKSADSGTTPHSYNSTLHTPHLGNSTLRIGTRKSALALAQTDMVADALRRAFPQEINIEIVPITTIGDSVLDRPLVSMVGKGVFVSEIERALLAGEIDLAVHSAKDLPLELAHGLEISAVLPRGDYRDVLVSLSSTSIDTSSHIVIGTGSVRRVSSFKRLYPHAEFRDIRGNVDTRLRKLKSGEYDAVVLAAAGLKRLGLYGTDGFTFTTYDYTEVLPAPCQGIIAVECARGSAASSFVENINDKDTYAVYLADRSVLARLGGDCTTPVGAYAEVHEGKVVLTVSS